MLDEIKAAAEHLCSLLHSSVDPSKFKTQFQSTLETRYASIWFPQDSLRASASRAILWHNHGGGEGCDEGLYRACMNSRSRETINVDDFFSSPFTLWVDPSCVAIRMGHGPGINLSSSTSFSSASPAVKVIYGHNQQQKLQPPILTISPSTPALDSKTETWSSLSQQMQPRHPTFYNHHHARSFSSSSVASSLMDSRSNSTTSYGYMSSVDDSERCPSLMSNSIQDSDSELSADDLIDSDCYKNFDIIDDEYDDEFEHRLGDETITEEVGDATICAEERDLAAIVNYDGGNVGVLGGGIRLGASSSPKAKKAFKMPSPFQPQQAHYAPPLPPPNSFQGFEQSLGFPAPHPSKQPMLDGYSIPMTKRVRSRGRRSRGRGAGRAARRQVAALQALTEAEQNLSSSMSSMGFQENSIDGCEDARIMAIVRQRADLVAKEMFKRALEQERSKAETRLHHVQYHQHHHLNHQYRSQEQSSHLQQVQYNHLHQHHQLQREQDQIQHSTPSHQFASHHPSQYQFIHPNQQHIQASY